MNKNRTTLFLQADEIDHLTIRYTDFGEPLNTESAMKMIKFYADCYDEVAEKISDFDTKTEELRKLSEKELYEVLVKIRTVLLEWAFEI